MRLIDADRLSEIIYGDVPAPYEDSREAKEECLRVIEEALTIDAVPVVRRKDCELHDSCYTEDVFKTVGMDLSKAFCCCGKRRADYEENRT